MSAKKRTYRRVMARAKGPPSAGMTLPIGGGPWFADAFNFRRAPNAVGLVEQFKSLVYMCAWKNANGVARVKLRLYGITKRGQARPKWWWGPRQVKSVNRLRLNSMPHAKTIAGVDEIDEITAHPLLDVVQHVSEDMDHSMLIQYLTICLDLFGTAYIWPIMNKMTGVPGELWPLPAQYVYPVNSYEMVPSAYIFGSETYQRDELIIFRRLAPKNPYGIGMGPTSASLEYARLEDVFVSLQDNMLSNGPRPSMIVSLKDPKSAFGSAERQRLEHEMERRGRAGRAGGVFVVDAAVTATPVSYSPTDLAGLKVAEYNMDRIAGCFDIPLPILTRDTNLANMQAARELHERDAIEPRCHNIASTLTRWTHSLDPQGKKGWDRLFWAFDPAVKEDAVATANLHKTYVDMGVVTRNEVRLELGYEPVECGDELLVSNALVPLGTEPEQPEPDKEEEAEAKALDAYGRRLLKEIERERRS